MKPENELTRTANELRATRREVHIRNVIAALTGLAVVGILSYGEWRATTEREQIICFAAEIHHADPPAGYDCQSR